MKKSLLSLAFLIFSVYSFAQTNFDKQIKIKSASLEKARTADECEALFADFSSMTTTTDANKWKAYFYASSASYKKGELLLKDGKNGNLSETNAVAYKYAMGALSSQPQNSDVLALIKLIEKQKKVIK